MPVAPENDIGIAGFEKNAILRIGNADIGIENGDKMQLAQGCCCSSGATSGASTAANGNVSSGGGRIGWQARFLTETKADRMIFILKQADDGVVNGKRCREDAPP